ncbi:MAG: hypothetical protein ACFFH0_10485 [Promethearchaeota archaeon]
MKPLEDLELSDFDEYKVWQFVVDEAGEIDYDNVVPVRAEAVVFEEDVTVMVPITAKLADGTFLRGTASVDGDPPKIYPAVTFGSEEQCFTLHLPPAPQFVLEKTGPAAFAAFLGSSESQIFPIEIQTDVNFRKTGEPLSSILTARGSRPKRWWQKLISRA